jgi:hypothetical protein
MRVAFRMKRAFQTAAVVLASVLLLGPLAQAAPSCRMLRAPGHCSSCPMPNPHSGSDAGMNSSAPCCQISAAKPSASVAWQPVVVYAPAPPAGGSVTTAVLFSPAPRASADEPSASAISSPQALLCTFLI